MSAGRKRRLLPAGHCRKCKDPTGGLSGLCADCWDAWFDSSASLDGGMPGDSDDDLRVSEAVERSVFARHGVES